MMAFRGYVFFLLEIDETIDISRACLQQHVFIIDQWHSKIFQLND